MTAKDHITPAQAAMDAATAYMLAESEIYPKIIGRGAPRETFQRIAIMLAGNNSMPIEQAMQIGRNIARNVEMEIYEQLRTD